LKQADDFGEGIGHSGLLRMKRGLPVVARPVQRTIISPIPLTPLET